MLNLLESFAYTLQNMPRNFTFIIDGGSDNRVALIETTAQGGQC